MTKCLRIGLLVGLLAMTAQGALGVDVTRGDRGQDVLKVQELLIHQGYLLDKGDGIFGNNTEYSVKVFQKDMHLPVTGKVDEATWKALQDNDVKFNTSSATQDDKSSVVSQGQKSLAVLTKQGKIERSIVSKGTSEGSPTHRDGSRAEGKPSTKKEATGSSQLGKNGAKGPTLRAGEYGLGSRDKGLIPLQERLSIGGFDTNGADGVFGQGTLQAVKAFQKAKKLPVTGIIDSRTKGAIEALPGRPHTFRKKIVMEASAYSSQDPGNGMYTARGNVLRHGLIAVDPRVIPLGSKVYVEGYGYAVADDIGGAIVGNRVDLGMDSHSQAIQFGRQQVTVYIL